MVIEKINAGFTFSNLSSSMNHSPEEPEGSISQANPFSFSVKKEQAGIRLDHFLVLKLPGFTRSLLSTSVSKGLIEVSGRAKKNSYRLKVRDVVSGTIYKEKPLEIVGQKISFEILYEDKYLLLISKPPDLVVHPGAGNAQRTLVNGLVSHCEGIADVGEADRPGIVHRLDKDTSGIMVVAKDSDVLRRLSILFKDREVKKNYLALVHGVMEKKSGRLVAPIGRHRVNRQKMSVQETSGKYAVSNWRVKEEFQGKYSLLEIGIETGRTHQIRVHMEYLGHPVAGDKLYGRRAYQEFPRQMLHASNLRFTHPITGQAMDYTAPLWEDFDEVLAALREA